MAVGLESDSTLLVCAVLLPGPKLERERDSKTVVAWLSLSTWGWPSVSGPRARRGRANLLAPPHDRFKASLVAGPNSTDQERGAPGVHFQRIIKKSDEKKRHILAHRDSYNLFLK